MSPPISVCVTVGTAVHEQSSVYCKTNDELDLNSTFQKPTNILHSHYITEVDEKVLHMAGMSKAPWGLPCKRDL